MEPRDLKDQISQLAVLDEPVRRSLYFYVVGRQAEVGRDEAAEAVGISRTLAGFHLDRLAEEGLLETSFRRLTGRAGPGAGRPAKLYRRSTQQVEVSLPARRYELAARIMANAIDNDHAPQAREGLSVSARQMGEQIGAASKVRLTSRGGKKRALKNVAAVLADHGYEPEPAAEEIMLRNCPFHALIAEHQQLVCRMNLALLEGVVAGLEVEGLQPVLEPRAGMCCVVVKVAK